MKKFLAGVLCAGLVFSMTACSSQSSSSQASGSGSAAGGTETYQVSFICPNTSLSYWSDVREGLEQGAEEFGVELDFVGPSKIDTQQQIQMMEAAIANKADGIIVAALDGNAFAPVIDARWMRASRSFAWMRILRTANVPALSERKIPKPAECWASRLWKP